MAWEGGEECQAKALQNPKSPSKDRCFGIESNGMGSHYWVLPGHRHADVDWRDIRIEHEWSLLEEMELLCS